VAFKIKEREIGGMNTHDILCVSCDTVIQKEEEGYCLITVDTEKDAYCYTCFDNQIMKGWGDNNSDEEVKEEESPNAMRGKNLWKRIRESVKQIQIKSTPPPPQMTLEPINTVTKMDSFSNVPLSVKKTLNRLSRNFNVSLNDLMEYAKFVEFKPPTTQTDDAPNVGPGYENPMSLFVSNKKKTHSEDVRTPAVLKTRKTPRITILRTGSGSSLKPRPSLMRRSRSLNSLPRHFKAK
jgi:hypothetical protein